MHTVVVGRTSSLDLARRWSRVWRADRGSWQQAWGPRASAEAMDVLAHELGRMLKARGLTLAVAESCTGGKLGDMITEVPGSSHYFMGGVICYGNMAKVDLLSVEKSALDSRGAVSEEVALQMAAGARKALRASVGVGITGIAGPSGGNMEKPVGLVYIAISSDQGSVCTRNLFDGDRSAVKNKAAKRALEMLEEFVSKEH